MSEKTKLREIGRLTELMVKAWNFVRVQGLSGREAAKRLGTSERALDRALEELERSYPKLRDFVFNVEVKGGILGPSSNILEAATQGQRQRKEEGYFLGRPPFGYRIKRGMLLVEPEEAKIVKYIFNERLRGKSTPQLATDTKKAPGAISRILRNPVYVRKGKHEPIIDEKTWEQVQPTNLKYLRRRAPFGYKKIVDRLVVDEEKAEIVRRIYDGRVQGKSIRRLSRDLDIRPRTIQNTLANPTYMGKILLDGELQEGTHAAIVDREKWFKVQSMRRYRPPWKIKRTFWDDKQKALLRKTVKKGKSPSEIAQFFKRSVSSIRGQMTRLGLRSPLRPGFKRWTPLEEQELRKMVEEGKSVRELALHFNRGIGAMRWKIKALKLMPRLKRRLWKPKEINKLREMAKEDKKIREMAVLLNRPKDSVRKKLQELKLLVQSV